MNTRRRLSGVVVSDKMDKTVLVTVTRTYRHKLYQKVVKSNKKYMAHDEMNTRIGDEVLIVESRPLSRHKRWVVEKVLQRSEIGEDVEQESVE